MRLSSTTIIIFTAALGGAAACGGPEGDFAQTNSFITASDPGCPQGTTFDSFTLQVGASRSGFDGALAGRINSEARRRGVTYCGMFDGIQYNTGADPTIICVPEVVPAEASSATWVSRRLVSGWTFVDSGVTGQNARSPRGIGLGEPNVFCTRQATIPEPVTFTFVQPPTSSPPAPSGCAGFTPAFTKSPGLVPLKSTTAVSLMTGEYYVALQRELERLEREVITDWTRQVDAQCKAHNAGCSGALDPSDPAFELRTRQVSRVISTPSVIGDLQLLESVSGVCSGQLTIVPPPLPPPPPPKVPPGPK